ncbi:hypothetical protein AB0I94_02360 [Streptomyces sp. NPDC050147]|uniref:hypothetical protein n=1 Tax=Streptomyces sp. NPDC050147 TaxID=3155513 RepID=UPI003428A907
MAAEIKLSVHVRAGDTEACWGSLRVPVADGRMDERAFRREMVGFLRAAADHLEKPSDEEDGETT